MSRFSSFGFGCGSPASSDRSTSPPSHCRGSSRVSTIQHAADQALERKRSDRMVRVRHMTLGKTSSFFHSLKDLFLDFKYEEEFDDGNWVGQDPHDIIVKLSRRNMKVVHRSFAAVAEHKAQIFIVHFENGQVHRYQPSSMHKLKVLDPAGRWNAAKGTLTSPHLVEKATVEHKKHSKGLLVHVKREEDAFLNDGAMLSRCLTLVLGDADLSSKQNIKLSKNGHLLFREADHDGDGAIDLTEFTAFCLRMVKEGADNVLASAKLSDRIYVARTIRRWAERENEGATMTEAEVSAAGLAWVGKGLRVRVAAAACPPCDHRATDVRPTCAGIRFRRALLSALERALQARQVRPAHGDIQAGREG